MTTRAVFDFGIDYGAFEDPWAGLAAMIFVQAYTDLARIGIKEYLATQGGIISKSEIKDFLTSKWGEFLTCELGLTRGEVRRFAARI